MKRFRKWTVEIHRRCIARHRLRSYLVRMKNSGIHTIDSAIFSDDYKRGGVQVRLLGLGKIKIPKGTAEQYDQMLRDVISNYSPNFEHRMANMTAGQSIRIKNED